jgi:hypothetical protein
MTAMSNSIRSPEINNDIICEAIACYSKATNKIAIKVGSDDRTMSLFLCNNCKPKFYSPYHDDKQSKLEVASN